MTAACWSASAWLLKTISLSKSDLNRPFSQLEAVSSSFFSPASGSPETAAVGIHYVQSCWGFTLNWCIFSTDSGFFFSDTPSESMVQKIFLSFSLGYTKAFNPRCKSSIHLKKKDEFTAAATEPFGPTSTNCQSTFAHPRDHQWCDWFVR